MKFLKRLIVLVVGLTLLAPSLAQAQTVVKVGVVGDSTNPIWDIVQENLGDEIEIELVSFNDGVYANSALSEGDLDITAFQHNAFLQQETEDKGYDFEVIGNTFLSPMNVYSDNISDLSELKDGDTILIPNNATNRGRALIVLNRARVIKVDPEKGHLPEITDIIENPLNLDIVEADPAMIPQALPDVAAGITNSDLAMDFGLNPNDDAIFALEIDPESEDLLPYINIIVARAEDKDNEDYQKVVKAYQQQNVADFIIENYGNSMVPVFEVATE
ncbi:MetQ/NlpA family ABC transporter substrate-binding protein [Aerococcaceae bacterium WGS1372]